MIDMCCVDFVLLNPDFTQTHKKNTFVPFYGVYEFSLYIYNYNCVNLENRLKSPCCLFSLV